MQAARVSTNVLCACFALLAAPLAASAQSADQDWLLGKVGELQADSASTGTGLVLWKDGKTIYIGGLGTRDKTSSQPVDAHTHFRIGSISKILVAIAVMQQVEEGRLRLQQPVSEIAPELGIDNPWDAIEPVRLVHLLEHSAGFDDMHFSHFNARPEDRTLSDAMRRFRAEFRVRWRPGTRFAYNNPGYGAAAYLVEKASGQSYASYIQQRILGPLGMTETYWQADQAKGSLAQGYGGSGEVVPFEELALFPAGGLISTPADMAKLLNWYVSAGGDGPRLLSAESIARLEMSETTAAGKAGLEQVYGLGNSGRERKGVLLHGHEGGISGYRSTFSYSRKLGLGYVVLTNSFDGGLVSDIEALILERYGRPPLPASTFAPAASGLAARSGWYRMANPRNEILAGLESLMNAAKVQIDGDRMHFAHPLLPIAYDYRIVNGNQLVAEDTAWPIGVLADEGSTPVIAHRVGHWVRGSWMTVALPVYAVFAALAALASSLLFALVWVPMRLLRRAQRSDTARLHRWPLMATLALLATGYAGASMPAEAVTSVNIHTAGIFLGTLLFAALSCVASVACWRLRAQTRTRRQRLSYLYAAALCVAAMGLSLWLWDIGWLGLRTWAW